MAQKTFTYIVDDLEGSDAEETVKFAPDSTSWTAHGAGKAENFSAEPC